MPFNENLIGDPVKRLIHGGAITTLVDTAFGVAIIQAQNNFRAMATLDLRIDHMRAAKSGEGVFAMAECYRITHTIAFVRSTVYADDINKPIATACSTFMRSNSSFPMSK